MTVKLAGAAEVATPPITFVQLRRIMQIVVEIEIEIEIVVGQEKAFQIMFDQATGSVLSVVSMSLLPKPSASSVALLKTQEAMGMTTAMTTIRVPTFDQEIGNAPSVASMSLHQRTSVSSAALPGVPRTKVGSS